jgi:hypothetical protein
MVCALISSLANASIRRVRADDFAHANSLVKDPEECTKACSRSDRHSSGCKYMEFVLMLDGLGEKVNGRRISEANKTRDEKKEGWILQNTTKKPLLTLPTPLALINLIKCHCASRICANPLYLVLYTKRTSKFDLYVADPRPGENLPAKLVSRSKLMALLHLASSVLRILVFIFDNGYEFALWLGSSILFFGCAIRLIICDAPSQVAFPLVLDYSFWIGDYDPLDVPVLLTTYSVFSHFPLI